MEPNNKKDFTPIGSAQETLFLEGPHSRWREFKFVFSVMRQFIRGFRKLHFVGPCITIFGSARFNEGHPHYQLAREMGYEMAAMGFTVMTGGGPGIMEAGNRGAKEAGGRSIGCNIVLPKEQHPNKYLDHWVDLDYFFVRKTLLTKYSYAFIVMPGGYGTLDEFFESITLIQTAKIKRFPVVLMGKEYHEKLYEHMHTMVDSQTISPEELELFLFTDSVQEAVAHIHRYAVQEYGLKRRSVKPAGILGEKQLNVKGAL